MRGRARIRVVRPFADPRSELKRSAELDFVRDREARRPRRALKGADILSGSTVAVAQLVESQIVILVVVGSSPISHPTTNVIEATPDLTVDQNQQVAG